MDRFHCLINGNRYFVLSLFMSLYLKTPNVTREIFRAAVRTAMPELELVSQTVWVNFYR